MPENNNSNNNTGHAPFSFPILVTSIIFATLHAINSLFFSWVLPTYTRIFCMYSQKEEGRYFFNASSPGNWGDLETETGKHQWVEPGKSTECCIIHNTFILPFCQIGQDERQWVGIMSEVKGWKLPIPRILILKLIGSCWKCFRKMTVGWDRVDFPFFWN